MAGIKIKATTIKQIQNKYERNVNSMNLALYQAIQNELNLRTENKTGGLFRNQSTNELRKLKADYEKEIFQYMVNKTINNMMKGCVV